MKLLFSCDEYCYCANGKYYLRDFGDILIKRYLNVFERIRVAVRTKYVSSDKLGIYNIPIDDRIEIYPLPFFQGPRQYLSVYVETKKMLRNITDGCEVALMRMPSSIAYAVLHKVKQRKMPYGVEVVANPKEIACNGGLKKTVFWSILHKDLLKACADSDCISYVTAHALQKIYPALKPGHYETYYSSVNLDNDFFIGHRDGFHDPFTICHVSNRILKKGKGHDVLLEVASNLLKRGYDIRVKIAGEGADVGYFKHMSYSLGISDKVDFVGFLNKNELKSLLLSSDLMLFPTLSEGLPRVIIEAMAAGLPCLSTPVGGISELLHTDCLFAPDDIEGFTLKIDQFINNKTIYVEHSKRNYQKSLEYSSEILMKRRIEMYNILKSKVV